MNQWLEEHLLKELEPQSTVILDNAAFHKKQEIRAILRAKGHDALFLPPYSPDFNPIEKVFAILKKQRQNAPTNTSIDQLVKMYGNFCK